MNRSCYPARCAAPRQCGVPGRILKLQDLAVNRPFAVLKDLLPPELLPAEPTPGRGRKRSDAKRSEAPAAKKGSAKGAGAPALEQQARPGGNKARAKPSKPGNRNKPQRAQAEPQNQTKARPQNPPPPAETPEAIEQRRKAAERAEQRRALANEGLAVLSEHYPTLFNRQQPVPLAIGIHKPLVAAAREGSLPVPVAAVRAAMGRWTGSWNYLGVMTEGATRLDLEGNPAGTVDAEQAEAARQTLAERRARQQNRRPKGKKSVKPEAKPAPAKQATQQPEPEPQPAQESTQTAPAAPPDQPTSGPASGESAAENPTAHEPSQPT